jgi:hypothetical protein
MTWLQCIGGLFLSLYLLLLLEAIHSQSYVSCLFDLLRLPLLNGVLSELFSSCPFSETTYIVKS